MSDFGETRDPRRRRADPTVIAECRLCDSLGFARSVVTGARGKCRHPFVRYYGHEPEATVFGSKVGPSEATSSASSGPAAVPSEGPHIGR